ncbi:MAG: hypothetical protein AB9866_13035 [Syntrophobacteraceae bacterium]
MRTSIFTALMAAALALFVSGCQTMDPYSRSGVVAPEDRVGISQPRQSAVWNGKDLTVEYKYSRDQSQLDISGRVDFADHMTSSFMTLHDFRLSAVFVDESGKVLGTHGLVTDRGYFHPIPFNARLTVPGGTVSLTFSYQGTAIEGGNDNGGGGNYFWYYPVH